MSARAHRAKSHGSRIRTVLGVIGLTLVGTALRLSTIDTRGLWLDEAISVKQASRTLPLLVKSLAEGVHPPLYHILLHYWLQYFGTGEITIRAYSVMWGILAIPIAFWVGNEVYGRRAGLIAAGIVAFSPYLVWYSQEARMYSMMLFFGLLSVGFLAVALRKNSAGAWLGYTAFTFCGMFTHYFFSFLVLGEVGYFLWFEIVRSEGELRRMGAATFRWNRPFALFGDLPLMGPWLASSAFLGITFGLWLTRSVFLPESSSGGLVSSATGAGLGYGQAAPNLAFRFNDVGLVIVEMLGGFHPSWAMFAFVAMWPLLISGILLMLDFMKPMRRVSAMLLCSSTGVLVIVLLGQWQGQVLASRYFIALAAPVLVLLGGVISRMPKRSRVVLLTAGAALCVVAWSSQSFDPNNLVRFDNREAIGYVAENHQPGDAVIYEPFYLDPLFAFYMPPTIPSHPFPQYGRYGVLRNGKEQLGQDLDRVVGPSRHVWLVLSFQNIATLRGDAYNTTMWFLRNGFHIKQDKHFQQVEVIEFEADATRPGLVVPGGR